MTLEIAENLLDKYPTLEDYLKGKGDNNPVHRCFYNKAYEIREGYLQFLEYEMANSDLMPAEVEALTRSKYFKWEKDQMFGHMIAVEFQSEKYDGLTISDVLGEEL